MEDAVVQTEEERGRSIEEDHEKAEAQTSPRREGRGEGYYRDYSACPALIGSTPAV